jgi:hypothetical protein
MALALASSLHAKRQQKGGGGESKSPDKEQKKKEQICGGGPPPQKKKKKNGLHCSCADTLPSQKFQTVELAASVRKLNFRNKPIIT